MAVPGNRTAGRRRAGIRMTKVASRGGVSGVRATGLRYVLGWLVMALCWLPLSAASRGVEAGQDLEQAAVPAGESLSFGTGFAFADEFSLAGGQAASAAGQGREQAAVPAVSFGKGFAFADEFSLAGRQAASAAGQGREQAAVLAGEGLSFDDGFIFADEFLEQDERAAPPWLDGLTVRLSQQFSGQANRHGVSVAPGFDIPRAPKWETSRFGVNIRYQNAFAPGWLWQASGQARYYWRGDYEYETAGDNVASEYRLNELFVQRSGGSHSLKFGRQTVVWGETVGNSVLDVINHSEFRDFTIIDIEDARLNQWLLVWDYFGESGTLSSFLNLYPEFNPPPVRGSPFFTESPFTLTDYDRGGELLLEAGSQWRWSRTGSDFAVMAAYLLENPLRYEAPPAGVGTALSHKNDFLLLGFSANRAVGRVLLNLDLAFSHGVRGTGFDLAGTGSVGLSGAARADRIGTSFGFEWAVDNNQNLSVGIQAQGLLPQGEDDRTPVAGDDERVFGSWLARYANSMDDGDLTLAVTMQGDLRADAALVFLGLDRRLDDHWSLAGQIIAIHARSDSPLRYFSEDLRVGLTLSYAF